MHMMTWRPGYSWWERFRELETLQNEMNRLFNAAPSRWNSTEKALLEGLWSPAVDVLDGKDHILVTAEIPGMKKEEIEVTVDGETLILKGEKRSEADGRNYVRTERFSGSFYRSIALPSEIDTAKVSASYRNGLLELTLPKKEEFKPKQIKIQVQ